MYLNLGKLSKKNSNYLKKVQTGLSLKKNKLAKLATASLKLKKHPNFLISLSCTECMANWQPYKLSQSEN